MWKGWEMKKRYCEMEEVVKWENSYYLLYRGYGDRFLSLISLTSSEQSPESYIGEVYSLSYSNICDALFPKVFSCDREEG